MYLKVCLNISAIEQQNKEEKKQQKWNDDEITGKKYFFPNLKFCSHMEQKEH